MDTSLGLLIASGATSPCWKATGQGDLHYPCSCGMAFTTAQGLACHPHCLQYFWTSVRLQQHLAYASRKTGVNACYQALARQGFCASYTAAYRPKELVGINRADALQALDPLPEPRDWMQDEVARLARDIADFGPAVAPPCSSAAPSCDELFRDLSHDVSQWFAAFQDAGFVRPADCELVDLWLSTLAASPPQDHEWAACWAFLVWGRAPLDELLQGLIDGEAEQIICDAFVELAGLFPLARANELRGQARARLAYLQDCQDRPIPHRPVRRGTANVKARIETTRLCRFGHMARRHPTYALDVQYDLPSYSCASLSGRNFGISCHSSVLRPTTGD